MPTIKELRKLTQPSEFNNLRERIHMFFSIYITKLLLNTPITPNQITLSLSFLNLVVAALFATGNYSFSILAIIPGELIRILDCTDGELARYRKKTSIQGIFLDLISEITFIPLVFVGITIGVFQNSLNPWFVIFGISAMFFNLLNAVIQFIKHESIFRKLLDAVQGNPPSELIGHSLKNLESPNSAKFSKPPFLRFLLRRLFPLIQGSDSIYIIYLAAIFNFLPFILIVYGTLLPLATIIILFNEIKIGTKPWEYLFKPYLSNKEPGS